uniref:Uncharacterized protein n=1 Tax=Anguilla anguilla TaxID=7936 RepID=A0A0E9W9A2_ANGAN
MKGDLLVCSIVAGAAANRTCADSLNITSCGYACALSLISDYPDDLMLGESMDFLYKLILVNVS